MTSKYNEWDILTLKEASEILSMHPEVLRKKAASGQVPAQKLGAGKKSPWRFLLSDLTEYLTTETRQKEKLQQDQHQKVSQLLKQLERTDDLDKQTEIMHVLAYLGTEDTVDSIKKYLHSPFDELRFLTCKAIITILGIKSKNILYNMMDIDEYNRIKLYIAGYFAANENDEKSKKLLLDYFEKGEERYKKDAAYHLIKVMPEKALPFIRKNLKSNIAPIRYNALIKLRDYVENYNGIEDDLLSLLSDSKIHIQKKVIEVIGVKKIKNAVPALQKIIDSDVKDEIKKEAGLAIARIFGYSSE